MNTRLSEDTAHMSASTGKERLYKLASSTWTVAAWVWSAVIIVFLVSFAAAVAATSDPRNNFETFILRWLSSSQSDPTQEFLRLAILMALILFVSLSLVSFILKSSLRPSTAVELQEILDLLRQDRAATELHEILSVLKRDQTAAQLHEMLNLMKQDQSAALLYELLGVLKGDRTAAHVQEILSLLKQKTSI